MTERGDALGVGPSACPFVALELDRDKRSDRPDYRHRCFAEPTPQPRAISHQAAYCLTANFPACPIFQDWAMRAAAQPTPAAGGADAAAMVPSGAEPAQAESPVVADAQPELPAPGEPWSPEAFATPDEGDEPEQLSVFSAGAAAAAPLPPPTQPVEAARAPYVSSQQPTAYVPPPADELYARAAPETAGSDEPPVPGFLAGRPPRPARASRQDVEFREKVSRDDLIPSWDRDGRFGAEPAERERGDRAGGIITAIAVIAILALGVAGVIFLPGLLAGGGPSRTPSPLPTVAPSGGVVLPSASATPLATVTPSATPEFTAAPTPTPRIYRVKRGDSLSSIARKFDVTVQEILDANPQIENPDHIQPGDLLTIPPPSQ